MKKSKSPLTVFSPKPSSGVPSKSVGRGKALHARSAEDIPKVLSRSSGGKDASTTSKSRGSSPAATGPAQTGIRYVTEGLIKKIAKEDSLEMITSLNLMLSKEGGKKIKYIENLEHLKRLQTLNLSCNVIEKIEKLERLTKLRELNLSFNSISRLEGLESLVNLQVLNVSGNLIEHVPVWLSKKLRALRVFRIAKNRINSLNEFSKLKTLPDLVQLSVSENPAADLPHSRLYLIFHLRSLESLDGQGIMGEERQESQSRFEQDEVEQLERQLEEGESRYRKLEEDHNKSVHELQQREATEQERKKKEQQSQDKMQELQRELETKNDLLKRKTAELTKACEKHYQLEQELAFYKIDSKFETLSHRPHTTDLDDGSNLDESPYIGRARYKANKFAQEQIIMATPQQAQLHQGPQSAAVAGGAVVGIHPDVREQMNETLDREISDKQQAIERAQGRLERLQEELTRTEQQVLSATQELKRVSELTPYTEHMEQHKQKLRQVLAKKMQHVNQLRDAAAQVEDDMDRVQSNAEHARGDIANLREKLSGMDPNDPNYRKTYAEMVDKEQQVSETSQMYGDLQQQLEEMMDTIATETNEIRKMEQKVNEDQISQNEDLREELGSIVGGLQTYLQSMKAQSEQQQRDLRELLAEKEALEGKIRMLETDLSLMDTEGTEYMELKARLVELEESLQEQKEQNDLLQEQVHLSQTQEPEIQDRIELAETEIKGLRKALKDTQRKAELERLALEKALDEERGRLKQVSRESQEAQSKEGALKRLTQQLEAVKALNHSLQEEMEDQRQQLQQQLNETIPPEDLRRRLEHLANVLTRGRSPIQPENRQDFVGQTFKHIQNFLQDKLNSSMRDAEQLQNDNARLDAEVEAMRSKINDLQNRASTSMNSELRGQRESYLGKLEAARKKDADQIKKLEEELKKLSKALKDAHAKQKQGSMGTDAGTGARTQMVYDPDQGTSTEGDSLNTEERDLLDELQRELMELRNSMRNKEIEQAKKLADAETEAIAKDNDLQQRQAAFQQDADRQRRELDLERQRQEARARVLEEDLARARSEADALQRMLEEKTHNLNNDPNPDISNQMIAAQEEEIAHLYDILERQRGEIDRLNGSLNHVIGEGPERYGPGYEEEVARLRGEVNRLKETLAMQSQYIQSMPSSTTHQSSARPHPHGVAMGTQSRMYSPTQSVPVFRQPIPQPPYQFQESVSRPHPEVQHTGAVHHPLRTQHHPHPQATHLQGHSSRSGQPHPHMVGGGDMTDGALPPQGSDKHGYHPKTRPGKAPDSTSKTMDQQWGDNPQHGPAGQQGEPRQVNQLPPLHSTPTRPGEAGDQPDGQTDHFIDHRESRTGLGRYWGTARGPTTYTDRREKKDASPPRAKVTPGHPGGDPQTPYGTPFQPARSHDVPYRPSAATASNFRDTQEVVPGAPDAPYPPGIGDAAPHYATETGEPYCMFDPTNVHLDLNDGMMGREAPLGWQPHPPGATGDHLQPTPEISPIRPVSVHPASGGFIGYTARGTGQRGPNTGHPTTATMPPRAVPQHTVTAPQDLMPPPPVPPQHNHGGMQSMPRSHRYDTTDRHQMAVPFFAQTPTTTGGPQPRFITPGKTGDPGIYPQVSEVPGQPVFIPVTPVYAPGNLNDAVTQTDAPPSVSQQPTVLMPISPIRAANGKMERVPRRGILKKPEEDGEGGEDSYLYCNVPEHHEMEDYIASLQKKIKELQALLKKDRLRRGSLSEDEEKRLIRRLIAELEERRSDLEGLDLAIERQKKDMRRMKKDERSLLLDKSAADEELAILKSRNSKLAKRRKFMEQFDSDSDDDFDYREAKQKQKHLQNEIECLEKTLVKRKGELRESDRMLKQCTENLRDARSQARDTVRRYDQASIGLQSTVRDAVEIEKRANDAGKELLKVSDELAVLKAEVRELSQKKSTQERLLKEITQIIAKKDKEFREVDSRAKQSTINCQRIQAELTAAQHRERETLGALKESEEVLTKRRQELNRLREQIEAQREELEKVDQHMGRRKTEMKMLEEALERKQSELNAVLRDAETEVSSKQRELKEHWEQAKALESQNTDLTSSVKVKRAELHQLRSDIDQENEVLERIVSAVSKQKAELKHTYEMQKLEQTELENLKSQHSQKLGELEKTQLALLDERSELERLTTETNRKTGELERLRQSLDRERQDLERITMEKRGLEERITTMSRDREILEENAKSVDNKVNTMKRTCKGLEEKIELGVHRVEKMDQELTQRETEVERLNMERSLLQKEVSSLKMILDTGRDELKELKDQVHDAEDQAKNLEQDIRETHHRRDSLRQEIDRLNEALRQSRMSHDLCVEQELQKQNDLQNVMSDLEAQQAECEEVRALVSSTNTELNRVRAELASTETEETRVKNNINQLKKEAESRAMNGEKFTELEKQIRDLRRELEERSREKNELAYALTRSYEEVQKMRSESNQERENMIKERLQLEGVIRDLKRQLGHAQEELVRQQKRAENQVLELESLAQEHFRRANQLNREKDDPKGGHSELKRQMPKPPSDKENDPLADISGPVHEEWKRKALKERLVQEQDYLRQQLRQQMSRHSEAMENVRLQSEGTLDNLRRKLNNLQDVLISSGQSAEIGQPARSGSPSRQGQRVRSPVRSYSSQRPRSRSRDRLNSPVFPERDVPVS